MKSLGLRYHPNFLRNQEYMEVFPQQVFLGNQLQWNRMWKRGVRGDVNPGDTHTRWMQVITCSPVLYGTLHYIVHQLMFSYFHAFFFSNVRSHAREQSTTSTFSKETGKINVFSWCFLGSQCYSSFRQKHRKPILGGFRVTYIRCVWSQKISQN